MYIYQDHILYPSVEVGPYKGKELLHIYKAKSFSPSPPLIYHRLSIYPSILYIKKSVKEEKIEQ